MSVPPQGMMAPGRGPPGGPPQGGPAPPPMAPPNSMGAPGMPPNGLEAAAAMVTQSAAQIAQMQQAVTMQLENMVASVNEIANSAMIRPFNSLAQAMMQTNATLQQTNQAVGQMAQAMTQSLQVITQASQMQSDRMVEAIMKIASSPIHYEWDKSGRVRLSQREIGSQLPLNLPMDNPGAI